MKRVYCLNCDRYSLLSNCEKNKCNICGRESVECEIKNEFFQTQKEMNCIFCKEKMKHEFEHKESNGFVYNLYHCTNCGSICKQHSEKKKELWIPLNDKINLELTNLVEIKTEYVVG